MLKLKKYSKKEWILSQLKLYSVSNMNKDFITKIKKHDYMYGIADFYFLEYKTKIIPLNINIYSKKLHIETLFAIPSLDIEYKVLNDYLHSMSNRDEAKRINRERHSIFNRD